MANTYTYGDAWDAAQLHFKRTLQDVGWDYATNNAISKMWRAYDWRGTLQPLAPFWLTPGQQDYGTPFYTIPNDFFGLRETYIVQVGANAIPARNTMRVVSNLEETHMVSFPQVICYRDSIKGFRIHPAAAYGVAAPLYLIDGTYKTRPPKITRNLANSLLFWDDVYFENFVDSLTWAMLKISGDRKAAMEQEEIFHRALAEATSVEHLELGEEVIHPTEALVVSNANNMGWFPL